MRTAVLFVCLGNICRSPTAEGLFRNHAAAAGLADRFVVDSAGLGPWHVGDPPDQRAIRTAARRGVDLAGLRGRQVSPADFGRFDWILGMDRANMAGLRRLQPPESRASVELFLAAALGEPREVPDPYHEPDHAFDAVFDLCDRAARALLDRLTADQAARS